MFASRSFRLVDAVLARCRKHGLTTSSVNYLRLSYRLGPNESWIALWRNKLAFALFERLPADLSKQAIDEFVGLLNTRQLTRELAGVFEGAPTAAQKPYCCAARYRR